MRKFGSYNRFKKMPFSSFLVPTLLFRILFLSLIFLSWNPIVGLPTTEKGEIVRNELAKRKECDRKLNACLHDCNNQYPIVQGRTPYIDRANCRESCAQTIREKEGCLIYFSTSRK
ncbi:hypothetical protein [Leptospira interrogans]|uniref:hypothetical protein n=1 Tax=Leptospira interrogans TaxID=173 RepID=UPI00077495BE|nr:hypothetical protein [Leptospira interrogans]